jgi:peptidoglycan hydrolase-like protein with peptidoglycan-binding domain
MTSAHTDRIPSMSRSVQAVALGTLVILGAACGHTHATTPPSAAAVPPTKPEHELGAETGTPVSSTPRGLMHDGAEKKIQERLRAKGLLAAEQCTGQFNVETRNALREFQTAEGLPTTGLPSYETVDHLGLKLESIFRTTRHSAGSPSVRTASPR